MKTNTHPIEQEELMAYLDGELPADRAAAAAMHLEQCSECRKLASELQGVSLKLMDWKVESLHVELLREATDTPNARHPRWLQLLGSRRVIPWAVGFAVCLVVAVIAKPSFYEMSPVAHELPMRRESGNKQEEGKQFDRLEQYSKLQKAPSSVPRASASAQADKSLNTSPDGLFNEKAGAGPAKVAPMVIRTASLTLAVPEFDKARISLEEILKRHRGYVGDLQVSSPSGDGRTLKATLRVPSDQLDATLTDLKKLGRVESESQNGQEVTAEYVDLEARLANSKHTEQRLTDVLKQRTGKLSDVLEVETEIARVRGEIESREAQRKSMANQVAFATLTATLTEDYKPKLQAVPPSTLMKFRNSAVEGYRSMMEGVVGLVIFVLSYGPSVLLWLALLFFPARFAWRRLAASAAR